MMGELGKDWLEGGGGHGARDGGWGGGTTKLGRLATLHCVFAAAETIPAVTSASS